MTDDTGTLKTQVCVVGGGPAGVLCAWLFAKRGIDVVLLEGERDFEREFRGDTLHASSLEILEQLGNAESVLELTNNTIDSLEMDIGNDRLTIADFSRLDTAYPFVAIIPQYMFLDLLVLQANALPNFSIHMNARVHELMEKDGRICGVKFRDSNGEHTVTASLTIGADGRGSTLRRLAGLKLAKTSPPMDILWFRLPVPDAIRGKGTVDARIGAGHMLISIDRKDYLQLGYVIMKGSYKELRTAGIGDFRKHITQLMPVLASTVNDLDNWSQVAILSVVTGRVDRWYRDGLLLIGDAAHVMSPVGGVGINYAIQDAVATVNLLADVVKDDNITPRALAAVQKRREPAVRFIQGIQSMIQKRVIRAALTSDAQFKPPLPLRIVSRVPFLQKKFAGLLAYGLQHERVEFDAADPLSGPG